MGLSPTNATDAFTDKDGDRIPNLWEYMRGTAANNAASFPAYDAIVTMNPVAGATPPQFATLQAAYDSLSGPADTYFLIQVKRGIYPAELSMGATALRVAWIAETGYERATGWEGVVISGSTSGYSASGLEFGDDTLVNGFIIDGSWSNSAAPAVRTFAANGTARVCLLNTIIRHWNPYFDSSSPYISGAIMNDGAILRLLHCTVVRSAAAAPVSPYAVAIIENKAGSTSQLRIFNSLIWNSPDNSLLDSNWYNYQIVRGDVSKVWVTTSHLQGLSNSGFNTSQVPTTGNSTNWPYVSWNGYIQTGSPATAKTGGSAQGVTKDIHNQTRPTSSVAMGVVQLVDTDADTLPDWWEQFWFGNLTKANSGAASISDPDGDGVFNFDEFWDATIPTDDQDGDGLLDWWEIANFGSIGAQNATGNPDNDGRTNLQEYQADTNPNAIDPDFDGDGDGLMDVWEMQYFGNITAYSGSDDPDIDGATNLEEQLRGSHPIITDADWDNDGWNDLWEKQTFGILSESPFTDFDGDGLLNGFEIAYGSDPFGEDSNWDGIPDGLAFYLGLPVFNTVTDTDGDGLSDAWELAHGTNPFLADTDNDGVPDALDALPLDPLAGTGNSVAGPPVITLTSPPNAVLQP